MARWQIRGAAWTGAILLALIGSHSAIPAPIEIGRDEGAGVWVRSLGGPFPSEVLLLERSLDLDAWQEMALAHEKLERYPELASPPGRQAFYRFRRRPAMSSDDWANQLDPH